jgi:hypothetical protein
VIDAEMQFGVLFVGLVMAAATLLTIDLKLPGGLIAASGGLAEARTASLDSIRFPHVLLRAKGPQTPVQPRS